MFVENAGGNATRARERRAGLPPEDRGVQEKGPALAGPRCFDSLRAQEDLVCFSFLPSGSAVP